MNRRPSATGPASLSGQRIGARLAAGLLATIMLAACASSAVVPPTAEPSASVPPRPPAAAASALPATSTPAPSAAPATLTASVLPGGYDPAKFGFAAKGMSHEFMAFVTTSHRGVVPVQSPSERQATHRCW